MPPRIGDSLYRVPEKLRGAALDKPLNLRSFARRGAESFQQKPFLYEVQITTRSKRTGTAVYRTISVTEQQRGELGGVLNDARDAIMESRISSGERFVSARLIGAYYNPTAGENG